MEQSKRDFGPGRKFDTGKERYDLIPVECIEDLAKILTMGAAKYEANNWQNVEDGENRYYAALMRHLIASRKGEKIDPESGLSHLAHAMCNVVFLLWLEKNKVYGEDKRFKQSDTTRHGCSCGDCNS